VLLFTVGSEGDVRPFAALAGQLRPRGITRCWLARRSSRAPGPPPAPGAGL